MKYLITLILWLVTLPVFAASPVVSLVTSRTSGTAPLCVHFDATGTTDADTTKPFHDLLYQWNFGDTNPGTWTYGANPGKVSKNLARGPVAAHCYETAGSYTALLQVCDSTSCVSTSQAITVTAADATFSTTNTTCFYNTTVGSGCPSGATQTQTSSWNTALAACLASGKRCLFKRGDTFTASASYDVSGTITTAQLGAYGSGAKPIVSGSSVDFISISGTITDLVVQDIDFYGASTATTCCSVMKFFAATTYVTALRVGCYDHGGCYTWQGNGDTLRGVGFFAVDTIGQRWSKGNWAFAVVQQSAFMGNYLDNIVVAGSCGNCTAEHGLRIQYAQKTVVSNNYFGAAANTNKHAFTLRAAPRGATGAVEADSLDSNKNVVSANYFDSTSYGAVPIKVAPSGFDQCHWLRDNLIERNLIMQPNVSGGQTMMVTGIRTSIRNNIIIDSWNYSALFVNVSDDNTGGCAADPIVNVANAIPAPTDNVIENNTYYHAGATASMTVLFINAKNGKTVTNTTGYNNLIRSPTSGSYSLTFEFPEGTGTITGTDAPTAYNSTSTQAKTSDPFVTTPADAITTRPVTSAYPSTSGTSRFPATAEDFFLCRDRNGTSRLGALVAASRAQCAGVAQ